MAARAGMATLITETRQMARAGTADHTILGDTYWSDNHIETRLDAYRQTHKRVPLEATYAYQNGTAIYTEYLIPAPYTWVEGTATGWDLRDGAGSAAPSYTADLTAGVITFAANTGGTAYYADMRTYDLNAAAADIWEIKAGFYEDKVDWESDNHRIRAQQQREACLQQARKYRSLAGVGYTRLVRVDEA